MARFAVGSRGLTVGTPLQPSKPIVNAGFVGTSHSTTPEAHGAVGNTPSHDDAPGIEAAIASVFAACIADGSYACEVVFDDKTTYYANRAPVVNATINGVASKGFGQITLPYVSYASGTTPKVTLVLRSRTHKQGQYQFQAETPCCIVSTVTSTPGYSASNGTPCIIGGAQPEQLPGLTVYAAGNNIDLIFDGVNLATPGAPWLCGVYAEHLQSVGGMMSITQPTAGFGGVSVSTQPTAFGVVMPSNTADGTGHWEFLQVSGYYCGVQMGDHFDAWHLWLWSNFVNLSNYGSPNSGTIIHFHSSDATYHIGYVDPAGTGWHYIPSGAPPLRILHWQIEDGFNPTYHVADALNNARIRADFCRVGTSTLGLLMPTYPSGQYCRLIDEFYLAGNIANPKLPAASTAQVVIDNAYPLQVWRDCILIVTGGSGVTVSIAGQSTGQSSGTFLVPCNQTFNLGAYTVAPTIKVIAI